MNPFLIFSDVFNDLLEINWNLKQEQLELVKRSVRDHNIGTQKGLIDELVFASVVDECPFIVQPIKYMRESLTFNTLGRFRWLEIAEFRIVTFGQLASMDVLFTTLDNKPTSYGNVISHYAGVGVFNDDKSTLTKVTTTTKPAVKTVIDKNTLVSSKVVKTIANNGSNDMDSEITGDINSRNDGDNKGLSSHNVGIALTTMLGLGSLLAARPRSAAGKNGNQ